MNCRARIGAAMVVSLFWLSGCGTTVLLPWKPATIEEHWSELKFDTVVHPEFKFQDLNLDLDQPGARPQLLTQSRDINRPILLVFPDGHNVSVFAEVMMSDGTVRPLPGSGYACPNDAKCTISFLGEFERSDSISGVRFRASTPVMIRRVSWNEWHGK